MGNTGSGGWCSTKIIRLNLIPKGGFGLLFYRLAMKIPIQIHYGLTFIASLGLLYIASPRQSLSFAWFLLPFLLIAYGIEFAKCLREPQRWASYRVRLCAWMICYSALVGIHEYRWQQERAVVAEIIASIHAYHAARGRYPSELSEVTNINTKSPIPMKYSIKNNQPYFHYIDSKQFYAFNFYDFATRRWTYKMA